MIHLKEALIVEGKYDKIKLSSLTDALIITTDGFGVFKRKVSAYQKPCGKPRYNNINRQRQRGL